MEVPSTSSPSTEESAEDANPLPHDGEEVDDGNSSDKARKEILSACENQSTQEKIETELAEMVETDLTLAANDDMSSNSLGEIQTIPSLGEESPSTVVNEEKEEIPNNEIVSTRSFAFSSNWSEIFGSPVESQGFSPSQAGSHHGLGLKLAVEEHFSTALFLGGVSKFLSGMAGIYEPLGNNLLRVSRMISPQQLPFKTSIDDDFRSLNEAIFSMGSGFRDSAQCYRSELVVSLQRILATVGNEREKTFKWYKEAKQGSVDARTIALSNYSKGTNAVETAETEIKLWFSNLRQKQINRTNEETEEGEVGIEIQETDMPWEKSLKTIGTTENEVDSTCLLIKKLRLVQSCEQAYIASVKKENECVQSSQEKEGLALNKIQKGEEDQINFFVNDILAKIFPENSGDGSKSTSQASLKMSDKDKQFGIQEKGNNLLSTLNLFKTQSTPYEEGMGIMDAETLGLSQDLGVLRDKMKSRFTERENRIKATETIIKLFEEITNVTAKASFRMRSHITNQRRKAASDAKASGSFIASQSGSIWETILKIFEDEAKLVSEVAFKITKLEKWFSSCKRALEIENDADNAAWKQVCDAARFETRLESRYKQTKQQVEIARQRASSKEAGLSLSLMGSTDSDENPQSPRKRTDSSGSGSGASAIQSTPNKVGLAFLKGGNAMKKLTENAMVQIAQISMAEKDQKEANDKLALEEARVKKKSAVLAYTTYTKERIRKIESEDDIGWTEMKNTVEELIESANALNTVRSNAFENRVSKELDTSFQSLMATKEDWSKRFREKILNAEQSSLSSTDAVTEYTLAINPIKSGNVDRILGMTETVTTLAALDLEIEPLEQEIKEGDVASCNDIPSDQSISPSDSTPAETSTDGTNSVRSEIGEKEVSTTEESSEMKAFIKRFWSKKPKDEKIPDILETHLCAYRPKERVTLLTSNLYGRLYTTKDAIYFLASDKHFTLQWDTITGIEKEKGFMGSNNDTDLVVSYRSDNEILSFLLCRLKDRDEVVAHLKRLKKESDERRASETPKDNNAADAKSSLVPPDSTLKKMNIVLSKTIKNMSIESLFESAWADRSEGESFYGSWLKEEECFDVATEEWKIAEDTRFRNEWCNEEYDQYRLVTFKFNRTTHLYIGPPVAIVKQRHFIRVEGKDRCVLAISAEFDGIPYADTFAVEMRWVATRKGAKDVQVEVGLFVNFKKRTMLRSQIESGTIEETRNVHLRLFDAVKNAARKSLGGQPGDGEEDEDEDEAEDDAVPVGTAEPGLLALFGSLVGPLDRSTVLSSIAAVCLLLAGSYAGRSLFGSPSSPDTQRLEHQMTELQNEVRALRRSLDLVTDLLKEVASQQCHPSE